MSWNIKTPGDYINGPLTVTASATITGDLTVDTSTLKVDSTNNRVGIGTASPATPLHLVGEFGLEEASPAGTGSKLRFIGDATKYNFRIGKQLNVSNGFEITPSTALGGTTFSNPVYTVTNDGIHTFLDGAGGTRMTLNSTGLGVGTSPSTKLDVLGSGDSELRLRAASDAALIFSETTANKNWKIKPSGGDLYFQYSATAYNSGYSSLMSLTATGNVGIGVTPSAWATTYKALQVSSVAGLSCNSGSAEVLLSNNYFRAASQDQYITTNFATIYQQVSGSHRFYTAPSGTAGNAITFTQAMTLDASGRLLVGTTTNTPSARQYINQTSGSNPALYIAGGASTTPLINFNGAGRFRSDGSYLVMETTNASGVIYVSANTNGVYLAVGGTSWTANSDERLKDIIEPINNAVAKVGSLRSVIGKFKNDETNTRRSFLIAQDVQAVLPEAVDASNPDRLGVAYSEVIPLLVAAIKELTARVQTLETR